jgi:hypothetical protein
VYVKAKKKANRLIQLRAAGACFGGVCTVVECISETSLYICWLLWRRK